MRHVVYVGGPGSGKTAILDELANAAQAAGALVLRAGGTQAEAQLPLAGLSQLFRPALADVLDLPVEHERVLERVLRVGAPVEHADPLVAMAVLACWNCSPVTSCWLWSSMTCSGSTAAPLILAFVGRRGADPRMATLAATRELAASAMSDTTVVELGPLSQADAQALLDARGSGLDPGLASSDPVAGAGKPARACRTSARCQGHLGGRRDRRHAAGHGPDPGVVREPSEPTPQRRAGAAAARGLPGVQ